MHILHFYFVEQNCSQAIGADILHLDNTQRLPLGLTSYILLIPSDCPQGLDTLLALFWEYTRKQNLSQGTLYRQILHRLSIHIRQLAPYEGLVLILYAFDEIIPGLTADVNRAGLVAKARGH